VLAWLDNPGDGSAQAVRRRLREWVSEYASPPKA
jgi:hypothetical protein